MKKKQEKWKEKEAKKVELEACYDSLSKLSPESDEYQKVLKRIIELHQTDKEKVKPDTVVKGLFSTIPVIGIIVYESCGNIIKSKALSFVSKIGL